VTDYDTIIYRWRQAVLGEPTGLTYDPSGGRVFGRGDRIYSYGEHFEMARPIRDRKSRQVTGWLINGDTYSVSTSRHQATLRSNLRRTGLPMLIVPHRALTAAGVTDLSSVRPVSINEEWTDQRVEYIHSVGYPEDTHNWWTPVDNQPDMWQTIHYTHHLGESVVTADVPYSTSRKCKACGGFGRRPGIRGKRFEERLWSDSTGCPVCNGQGVAVTRHTRRATFLSGFDSQEKPAAYFFCELPKGAAVTTVAEAYESLKPEPVRIAEQLGRAVKRQGDVFAVPTELDTRTLRQMGAARSKSEFILGVNHRATEVAVTPDGLTFIRGTITHDPGQWRDPDHKRVSVGKAWHLAVKNTVPVAR
jgi:hypothetical protein